MLSGDRVACLPDVHLLHTSVHLAVLVKSLVLVLYAVPLSSAIAKRVLGLDVSSKYRKEQEMGSPA